jgi:hypothetical protein
MTTRREILLSACSLAAISISPFKAKARGETLPPAASSNMPSEAISLLDFEALARERIPHMAFEYINGGAADESDYRR